MSEKSNEECSAERRGLARADDFRTFIGRELSSPSRSAKNSFMVVYRRMNDYIPSSKFSVGCRVEARTGRTGDGGIPWAKPPPRWRAPLYPDGIPRKRRLDTPASAILFSPVVGRSIPPCLTTRNGARNASPCWERSAGWVTVTNFTTGQYLPVLQCRFHRLQIPSRQHRRRRRILPRRPSPLGIRIHRIERA